MSTEKQQAANKPIAMDSTDTLMDKADKPISIPSIECTDFACLKANEGQLIHVRGTYLFPKKKAFAQTRIKLDDDTEVVLSAPRDGVFAQVNDGATVVVTGTIFTGEIPSRYKLIGRTPDPHMVDIISATKQ